MAVREKVLVIGDSLGAVPIQPVNEWVVVEELPKKTMVRGLHIPDKYQDKSNLCRVLAVGPGFMNERTGERVPLAVKAGDLVMVTKWAGDSIKVAGQSIVFVREGEILGTLP